MNTKLETVDMDDLFKKFYFPSLVNRTLSALLLIPAVLLFNFSDSLFIIVVFAVMIWSLKEWIDIMDISDDQALKIWIGYLFFLIALIIGMTYSLSWIISFMGALVAGCVLGGFTLTQRRYHTPFWLISGILYTAAGGLSMIGLRYQPDGFWLILFLFLVVWSTDIFSYLVGRIFGSLGRKGSWIYLPSWINPNKTWPGLIGGVSAPSLVGGLIVFFWQYENFASLFLAIISLSCLCQVGDLYLSVMKRRYAPSDGDHLIPGHGRLLDRTDGLYLSSTGFLIGYLSV